ncbi:MAG: acyltransferase [Methylococcales bacterium]|nr:acyltransferase [Methylococcales bacterium]
MGALRFLLAVTVLISHLGIKIKGYTPGVIAVIVFYMLAGHVVARLWGKWRHQSDASRRFYYDRAWRILPQYTVALFFSILIWLDGAQSPFLATQPGLFDWLANVLIIPLNFYMYTGQDAFTLIPPAWSLGAEMQFYLIAPLLLSQKLFNLLMVFGLSLGIFALAQLQILDTDYYGYRLIPGVLFIFLLGALHELSCRHRAVHKLLVILWLLNFTYLLWLFTVAQHLPYNEEVALGLMIAMPLLALLNRPKTDKQYGSIATYFDRRLGALSYGVFLYHFPVIWLLKLQPPVLAIHDIIAVAALSLGCAAFGHWAVERPLWERFRSVL